MQSKALYQYLLQAGVLNGTPDVLALAKRRYRAIYKKQWRQQRQQQKELRITFNHTEFEAIAFNATKQQMTRTAYVRSIVLQTVGEHSHLITKDQLQQVLQLVSMAIVGIVKRPHSPQRIAELLKQAEDVLLLYLSKHEP